MDELVTLSRKDIDRLKYENTIVALQNRVRQLQDLLQEEKVARKTDQAKHQRVVRELNTQITNQDVGKHIAFLEERCETLADTCESLSMELKRCEAELVSARMFDTKDPA